VPKILPRTFEEITLHPELIARAFLRSIMPTDFIKKPSMPRAFAFSSEI